MYNAASATLTELFIHCILNAGLLSAENIKVYKSFAIASYRNGY